MMGEMSLIDTKQTFVKTRISVFQRNYFRITYGYVSNTVCLANVASLSTNYALYAQLD